MEIGRIFAIVGEGHRSMLISCLIRNHFHINHVVSLPLLLSADIPCEGNASGIEVVNKRKGNVVMPLF